eukprot:CAMPEP_0175079678 /NCGR_PEP_ID=MMETSP0052_2-20121109/24971_1 /TAXON_ID=51329 ORGANISM="Polytomella parva, Strain SAG 63-3" /NCGR_SAMPLE_ID=MMETSP0052_2 /ASSEMBLY_ACC=CAM_ASM_000194 /LENGTH=545 /DNA_ID=CAMNT_0016350065 /DNA_START=363 /DNA_END=2000 /DNA_ORIENTATION=+
MYTNQHNIMTLEDRDLEKQEVQATSMNSSRFKRQCKPIVQGFKTLINAVKDLNNMFFDKHASIESDKAIQSQIKAIQEEADNRLEALQSENKELLAENKSLKEVNAILNSTMSTKQEEIVELEARVNAVTMDFEKESSNTHELEIAKNVLSKNLEDSMQSLSVKDKELQELQSQYYMERKRLEDSIEDFKNEIKGLGMKLKKAEVENKAQPCSNIERDNSSAIFAPIPSTKSIHKSIVTAGKCLYCFNAFDINEHNILAVVHDYISVYLYSENTKIEEKLCTCQYDVCSLAWNEQGTLLAIGGCHNKNKNDTIQVWDITDRKITKRLLIEHEDQDCYCLDWKGDTIIAGTDNYIYQWDITNPEKDRDRQRNKALFPNNAIFNIHNGCIASVQWSDCKSKLATITDCGDMCIYDEKFNYTHQVKAHDDYCDARLQWCPWDNQVIATCCDKGGYLKIWRVEKNITLINQVQHESPIRSIKWILSKKAILSAHTDKHLILWKYPSLGISKTMKGHTDTPCYLASNADRSAIVSKSDEEIIFWKPFDEF